MLLDCQMAQILNSRTRRSLSSHSKLNGLFTFDLARLINVNADLHYIRSVEFKLSNVKLLEIPDSVVFDGFKHRTSRCKNAIEYRLKATNPVSMIKSVFSADVEYFVQFDAGLDASMKETTVRQLAAELGAKAKTDQTNEAKLTGASLVWGVRDDSALARFGYQIPQHGTNESASASRPILFGKGPVTSVEPVLADGDHASMESEKKQ